MMGILINNNELKMLENEETGNCYPGIHLELEELQRKHWFYGVVGFNINGSSSFSLVRPIVFLNILTWLASTHSVRGYFIPFI